MNDVCIMVFPMTNTTSDFVIVMNKHRDYFRETLAQKL